jgi:hypothetical protein
MWTSTYYNYWTYWNLRHKVTFDGDARLIIVNYGVTELDVEIDIYSDWKEWLRIYDYEKYVQAISTIGGEPIGGGQYVGATFFLENGWRIRPWEGDQTLVINGNLYTREAGQSPTIKPLGDWSVNVIYTRSSLVTKVETSTSSGSVAPTAQEIAQAVWDLSLSASYAPGTFGGQVGTQVLTFAQYLAAK